MLTDIAVRKAQARDKPYKMFDSNGLFLLVTPAGGKLWRLRYKIGGKEKLLSIGPYPEVTLAAARDARDEARAGLRAGRDPSLVRKQLRAQAANDDRKFEKVARDWHTLNKSRWTERHTADVMISLEQMVFPLLGNVDVAEITPPMVLDVIRRIEARPALETARRVRQRMSAIFLFAMGLGLATTDPAAVIQKAMAPMTKGRQPALVTLEEAREALAACEAIPAHPVTRLAMRFLALTHVRPGEVHGTRWTEFEELEGDEPLWLIPAARMKMKEAHKVPLSRQAVEVIEALRELTGRMPFVFPNGRNAHKPMSENALGYLLNRAGYHQRHVPHGWRSTFSTVMNERFPADRAVIDLMLAHAPKDKVEAAYNRAKHLKRRRELSQIWADLLLEGMRPAHEIWQTAFTYFKIIGRGCMYLSTVLDDVSRYIIAWKLYTNMRAEDVTDTLDLAPAASGCNHATVLHKPRLLSDNGPSYIANDLTEYIKANKMSHVHGARRHPQTQGKIERWHQTLKNRILLENYFLPGDQEGQIKALVEHYHHQRYHKSLNNVKSADAYFVRAPAIIRQRERIKRQTIENRRLQHRKLAA